MVPEALHTQLSVAGLDVFCPSSQGSKYKISFAQTIQKGGWGDQKNL